MEALIALVLSVIAGFSGGRWHLRRFRRYRQRALAKQEADRTAAARPTGTGG